MGCVCLLSIAIRIFRASHDPSDKFLVPKHLSSLRGPPCSNGLGALATKHPAACEPAQHFFDFAIRKWLRSTIRHRVQQCIS